MTASRPLRIGITGPIGCGKSTVAGWLAELGAVVIDADQVARGVTPPGSAALAAVVGAFGPGVLRADGTLDRAALGRIVFADPEALRRLESIIHPAVRAPILALIAAADGSGAPAVVIEAIKLVEGGLASLCNEVWLVTCDPAVQLARLEGRAAATGRPADPADTQARIAAQGDLVARLTPFATRVLDTSGSIAESRSRVSSAFEAALTGAKRTRP
ncbi:MAG: dephospho-CoA kinase [Chloroflexi bacterium]|nr:dephospho-CoA kinase [Chloroflexota bacterium]